VELARALRCVLHLTTFYVGPSDVTRQLRFTFSTRRIEMSEQLLKLGHGGFEFQAEATPRAMWNMRCPSLNPRSVRLFCVLHAPVERRFAQRVIIPKNNGRSRRTSGRNQARLMQWLKRLRILHLRRSSCTGLSKRAQRPNPSIEGPKRLRLLVTPHVKR
jgi:hypothetical protein